MVLIFDCESTGLDVLNDRVWCLVAKDFNTGQVYEFRPDELDQVEKFFDTAEKIVAHNGIAFDLPILKNNGILPEDFPFGKIVDTLVLSRLYFPDRENGHSVEAWGKRLGHPKVSHETWSEFSEDMLHRCREDVEIQSKIYQELLKEKGDWDWTLAENIEHNVQKILFEQEVNGWKFDVARAKELVSWLEGEMEKLEQEIVPKLPLYYQYKGDLKKPFKKDGTLSKQAEEWKDGYTKYSSKICSNYIDGFGNCVFEQNDSVYPDISGPFGRIDWLPIKLSQREKLANALIYLGWKPSSYTAKGKPQITPDKNPCPNLKKLGDIGPKLSRYYLCSHRKGQISGWLKHVRGDGRIPAKVTGMTNTGRMKHAVVTNVPKASPDVFLGKEMRELFICEEGYKLVGLDADSLELRVAAHYANSKPFIKALVEGNKEKGTDAHTKIMNLGKKHGITSRDGGKAANYMGIYGASGPKFASQLELSKAQGYKVREIVAKAFPGLMELKPKVEKASKRGYLIGIDGRKVWMRRDYDGKVMSHKALNTLFQSAGGILLKFVLCVLYYQCKKAGLSVRFVGNIHDEVEAEVPEKEVDKYRELCYNTFHKTSEYFKLKCPIECEVKANYNWSLTH